jgi:hypothetical protein
MSIMTSFSTTSVVFARDRVNVMDAQQSVQKNPLASFIGMVFPAGLAMCAFRQLSPMDLEILCVGLCARIRLPCC